MLRKAWALAGAGILFALVAVVAGSAAHAASGALRVAVSVSPDPMIIGAEAVYTVTVTNDSDHDASGVTVTDTLDSNVTVGALPAGCTASGQVITCGGAGTTPGAGQVLTYEIPVTVKADLSDGTNITDQVSASTSTSDISGDSTQLISQSMTQTDVSITKTGPAEVSPDGTISYTLSVTNHGPSDAVSVTVQDPTNGNLTTITELPSECPASGLTVTCSLGTLTPGETREFTFRVKVNSDVEAGTEIENCATVYTGSRETDTENNQSCVSTTVEPGGGGKTPTADVAIVKSAPATAEAGGTFTYTVTVTNNGPDTAQDVIISDVVPDQETVVSVPDGCSLSGKTVTCEAGDLVVGDKRTFQFTVRDDADLPAGTLLHNCGEVTSEASDENLDNNVSCADTTVEEPEPTASPTPKPSPTSHMTSGPEPSRTSCSCLGGWHDPAPRPSPTPAGLIADLLGLVL